MHQLKATCALIILSLVILRTESASAQADWDELKPGNWQGVIQSPEGDIPFRFSLNKNENGEAEVLIDLVGYGYYGIRPEARVTENSLKLAIKVYRKTATLTLRTDGDLLHGTWKADGQVLDAMAVPAIASMPAPTQEEIVFHNGEVKLAGTLILPKGEGPFPAVVWTHGSGPVDRSDPIYRSLAYWMADFGIASLIYDKRGAGESTGSHARDPYPELADDAIAGVRALADHAKIDVDQIGVGGVSQGGWITPLAASRSEDVRFCVALSAPGITPPEQNIFNQHNKILNAGFSVEDANDASNVLAAAYNHAKTGQGREKALQGLTWAREQAWYETAWEIAYFEKEPLPQGPISNPFLDLEPKKVWRKVKVPVVAIWGELDSVVPAPLSERIVRQALDEIDNQHRTLIVLPGVNHDLRTHSKNSWRRFHPGNQAMIDFIHGMKERKLPQVPSVMEEK